MIPTAYKDLKNDLVGNPIAWLEPGKKENLDEEKFTFGTAKYIIKLIFQIQIIVFDFQTTTIGVAKYKIESLVLKAKYKL